MFSKIIDVIKKIMPLNMFIILYTVWNCVSDIIDIMTTGLVTEKLILREREKWIFTYYFDILNIFITGTEFILNIIFSILLLRAFPNKNIDEIEDEEYNTNVKLSEEQINQISSEYFDGVSHNIIHEDI